MFIKKLRVNAAGSGLGPWFALCPLLFVPCLQRETPFHNCLIPMSATEVSPTKPEDLRNMLHLVPTHSSCRFKAFLGHGLKMLSFPPIKFQSPEVPQEKQRVRATAKSLLGVPHLFTSCMAAPCKLCGEEVEKRQAVLDQCRTFVCPNQPGWSDRSTPGPR